MHQLRHLFSKLLIFVLVSAIYLPHAFAAPATAIFKMQSSASSVTVGDTFTVDFKIDSGGQAISWVTGNVSFSSSTLEYVSADATGSDFNVQVTVPTGSNPFSFERTRFDDGYNGSNGQMIRVTFKAKTTGTGTVNYNQNDSQALAFSDSTNILQSVQGTSVTINAAATPTPTPAPPQNNDDDSSDSTSGNTNSGDTSSNNTSNTSTNTSSSTNTSTNTSTSSNTSSNTSSPTTTSTNSGSTKTSTTKSTPTPGPKITNTPHSSATTSPTPTSDASISPTADPILASDTTIDTLDLTGNMGESATASGSSFTALLWVGALLITISLGLFGYWFYRHNKLAVQQLDAANPMSEDTPATLPSQESNPSSFSTIGSKPLDIPENKINTDL